MKKLFLLIAFTGIVGAASASSVLSISNNTIVNCGGEDKKGDEKKKKADKADCKKACSDDKTAKAGCHEGTAAKSCCKDKAAAKTATTTTDATKK